MSPLIDFIVERLEREPAVEGAFVSGSLVDGNRDEYSDLDLGVASAEDEAAFVAVYALRGALMAAAGEPVHHLERGWGHCRMVAALYGKSSFPPVGLEVDVVFSRLQHVGEQMPYAPYEIVFDRTGRLALALQGLPTHKPITDVRAELETDLRRIPFVVHDALKALRRSDSLYVQALFEELRQAIFQTAAARAGVPGYGAKRAYRYLSPAEVEVVADSYQDASEHSLRELLKLLFDCLGQVEGDYQVEAAVGRCRRAVRQIL